MRPLLGELREALASGRDERPEPFTMSLGVSESILSSWGPGLLREAMAAIPCLDLAIHAHRSPVVVDRVRSGEYMLGLCAGIAETAPDLSVLTVAREPMVLIPSGLRRIRIRRGTPVITIEESAATWSSIHRGLRSTGIDIEATVESFTAIARMAIAGLGHGLVPRGVAVALGLDLSQFQALAGGRITRPISLVGRKSLLARSPVADFVDRVQTLAAAACGPPPRPTG